MEKVKVLLAAWHKNAVARGNAAAKFVNAAAKIVNVAAKIVNAAAKIESAATKIVNAKGAGYFPGMFTV